MIYLAVLKGQFHVIGVLMLVSHSPINSFEGKQASKTTRM